MPELQNYEIILNKKIKRGNFYRKMYDILVSLDESRKGGAHIRL
jgi:hypothetical protein